MIDEQLIGVHGRTADAGTAPGLTLRRWVGIVRRVPPRAFALAAGTVIVCAFCASLALPAFVETSSACAANPNSQSCCYELAADDFATRACDQVE